MFKKNKSLVVIQLIWAIAIAILAFGLYFLVLKSSFEDPIATIKNNILTTQLVMIGFSIITTLLVTIFTRKKEKLIKKFKVIAIVSILMIGAQLCIKIDMDNKYNEETFEQFYEDANLDNEYKRDITIGLYGVRIVDAKEGYIQKSMISYNIFKIKTMLYIVIHAIFVILILFLIIKLISIEDRKAKLAKDDFIIGDRE